MSDVEYEVMVTEVVEYKVTVWAPDSHTAGELAENAVIEEGGKWFQAVTERQSGFTEQVGPLTPAPNRVGEIPHAEPSELRTPSTCKVCGQVVEYSGTDDDNVGIWEHRVTGDYFCEVVE